MANFQRQRFTRFMKVFQLHQSDEALRGAMDIDWVSAIVEILRGAIIAEKLFPIVIETVDEAFLKFVAVAGLADAAQRAEIESSMKIINPGVFIRFTINPR